MEKKDIFRKNGISFFLEGEPPEVSSLGRMNARL